MSENQLNPQRIFHSLGSRSPAIPAFAIAVSGGADSMALMHLVLEWRKACLADNKSIPDIHILTVDHGLRPEAADEAQWVAEQASTLGLNATVLTWVGEKPETGVQEAARQTRYALMTEWCRSNNALMLMTAHHQDDQAETILMRLARGSGVDGLSGMSESTMINGVEILRPLLKTPGEQLRAYLEARHIKWLEDPGNQNEKYERVKVRKTLTVLNEMGLRAKDISRSAHRLRRARTALEQFAEQTFTEIVGLQPEGYAVVDLPELTSLPDEIALRCLERMLREIGSIERQSSMAKIETTCQDLLSSKDMKDQAIAGCIISVTDNTLAIFREVRGKQLAQQTLTPGEKCIWDNRFDIFTSAQAPSGLYVRFLTEKVYQSLAKEQMLPHKKETKASVKHLRASLPSIWLDGELMCIPHLDFARADFDKKLINITFAKET